MTLSAPTSITLFSCSTAPKVSALTLSGSFKSAGGGGVVSRRWSRSPCIVLCASRPRGMTEPIDEKKSSLNSAQAPAEICASSSEHDQDETPTYRTFLEARTEQDLLSGIQKEVEAGRLPLDIAEGMEELYHNYRNAVFHSGNPKALEIVLSNMAVALDRIFMDVRVPFQFSPHHQAIRKPFDYYLFGQKYISPLIDFRNSFLGNASLFNEMETKLQQGENVILISNHQTEADPAIVALLLEPTNPFIAENIIYMAGDRVVTDPLCKPFSMGRNLLCVHSKKHMNDDPELVEIKRRANTKSLKEMAVLLRSGSKIIWIAPSGGRDRPDPVTKEWFPAPFDASSVDNMRRLAEHAGVPANIYPLAILCYDIMPPPPMVEKEIGEKRVLYFHGVGLSAAPRISYQNVAATLNDTEEARSLYSQLLYSSICEQYKILNSAIHCKQGLNASTPTITLSEAALEWINWQPWSVNLTRESLHDHTGE